MEQRNNLTSNQSLKQYWKMLSPEQQQSLYNRLTGFENATTNTGAIGFQNLANQIMRVNPYIQQLQQQYLDTYNGRYYE